MKFGVKFALVTMTALAAMACGNKTPEQAAQDVKNQVNGTQSADVQTASYKGTCHAAIIPTLSTTAIDEYDLSPGHFVKKTIYFSDANCTTQAFVAQQSGDLIDKGPSDTVANARVVNFNITSVTLLPYSDHATKEFNALKVCSVASWTMNTQVDVSAQRGDLKCPGQGVRVAYDLMLIDSSNHLFLGANADKTNENDRPKQVDTTDFFVRQ